MPSSLLNRRTESWELMPARTSLILSMPFPKSTTISEAHFTPYLSEFLASYTALAALITPFEGTHP